MSGDLNEIERYFEGEDVVLWSYLEDLAMSKPEDSMEFKCLLDCKGKDQIDKRRRFLASEQYLVM
jgi:hypothetical protein